MRGTRESLKPLDMTVAVDHYDEEVWLDHHHEAFLPIVRASVERARARTAGLPTLQAV